MRFESDYTEEINDEKTLTVLSGQEESISKEASQKKLQMLLDYCRLRDSQFDIRPSRFREIRILKFYKQMKTLAFIHNGKVTLELDKKKMKARLTYWGKCITLIPEDNCESRNLLVNLLNTYELIYFEVEDGGIQICVEERLFEEIQVKNQETELLKLRKLMSSDV